MSRITGKRPSVIIPKTDERLDDCISKSPPLVPDISPAQKAMIYEQLSKTLILTQTVSRDEASGAETKKHAEKATELTRSESKGQKIGRKIKSLFMNDPRTPSRKHSLDNRVVYLDPEEEELYRLSVKHKLRRAM